MNDSSSATSKPKAQVDAAVPYPPSYIDRFLVAIERLPLPYGLVYLLLFILQSGLIHIVAWIDGWLPVFSFSPILVLFPLWLWFPFTVMTYLNSISEQAVSSFSPLLDLSGEQLELLSYEFTNMPSRGVWLGSLIWSVVYLIFTLASYNTFYVSYGIGLIARSIIMLNGLPSFLFGSAIYYHTVHQLRLVNRTVRLVKHFNLFQLNPVYAFSRVTSQTALAWVLLLSLTLLLFPIQIAFVETLLMLVSQVLLALAGFVLPLWIVHRRLELEKSELQSEHNRRFETTLAELHRYVDAKNYEEVGHINSVMSGLNAEREVLAKIPTWPWRTGNLTGFLTAIMLPIIIFIIQRVLGRLLGG
jgi:hypothetical protein